jgi:uncharacterized protein YndB with AHSA1/START domain
VTNNERDLRIVGSLRAVGGKGVVRIEVRFDTGIDDVWSAITDPERLSRWHSRVQGDLRQGGTFRIYVESDDWEGIGRVEVCEPPRRLVVTSRESEESWRRGQGVPPFDSTIEVTLSTQGGPTVLVVQVEGVPLEPLAFYGVGWQIHAESLGDYLAGRVRGDVESRWEELIPAYQAMAARIG